MRGTFEYKLDGKGDALNRLLNFPLTPPAIEF
jgi:hypothetical protein